MLVNTVTNVNKRHFIVKCYQIKYILLVQIKKLMVTEIQ